MFDCPQTREKTQGRTLTNIEIKARYEAGTMGYESFDYWRFDDFMDRSRVLLDTFLKFRSKVDEGIQAEKISRGMT